MVFKVQMGNKIKAAKVLLENYYPTDKIQVEIIPAETTNKTNFNLHQSLGVKKPRQTIVMLYGMDYAGEEDPRLVKFANAFAKSGFRVAVPCLNGLKSLEFQIDDVDRICDLALYLGQTLSDTVGICAFSIGGGYALVAAANLVNQIAIDPILLFSPYYCLNELWEYWKDKDLVQPTNDREWDHFLWNKMALAYRGLDSLGFSQNEREDFLYRLRHYCSEDSLDKKRAYYLQSLAHLKVPKYGDFPIRSEILDALSPKGKLYNIKGKVLLVHDTNDLMIPPSHTERIFKELNGSKMTSSITHRKIITPLLSHVTINNSWKLMDGLSILDMMGEFF
jgi:pimeloyl-ACP methyl ester carboxylesterase